MLRLDEQTWGVDSPADRRALGRWIRAMDERRALDSTYLQEFVAAHQAGQAQLDWWAGVASLLVPPYGRRRSETPFSLLGNSLPYIC